MLDKRMMTNEFFRLIKDYPHIAFNYRSFKGGNNTPDKDFEHLVVLEPRMADPEAWNVNVIKEYKTYITWNIRFAGMLKKCGSLKNTEIILVKGSVFCNHYAQLTEWSGYDSRLSGVCIMNKLYQMGGDGEITLLREDAANILSKRMLVHVFAPVENSWGGTCYQGELRSPIHHSHELQLMEMAKYRFMLCFESTYHELWSYGFMTERLFNAFKTKTVPIYYGCYNIQDYVPTNLFIDYRNFKNMDALAEYILHFPRERWIEMTEKAYKWEKTCDIGSMKNFEIVLKGLE